MPDNLGQPKHSNIKYYVSTFIDGSFVSTVNSPHLDNFAKVREKGSKKSCFSTEHTTIELIVSIP